MAIKVIPMPIAVAIAGGDKAVYMFRSISDDTPLSDLRDATGFIFFENEELPTAEEESKEEPEKKSEPKKTEPKRKNAGNTNAKKDIDDGKIRACYDSRRDEARSADSRQSLDEDGDIQDQSGKERGMTREEAIEVLENASIEPTWGGSFRATSEALTMAIEALKREDTMLKEIERAVLHGERRETNG